MSLRIHTCSCLCMYSIERESDLYAAILSYQVSIRILWMFRIRIEFENTRWKKGEGASRLEYQQTGVCRSWHANCLCCIHCIQPNTSMKHICHICTSLVARKLGAICWSKELKKYKGHTTPMPTPTATKFPIHSTRASQCEILKQFYMHSRYWKCPSVAIPGYSETTSCTDVPHVQMNLMSRLSNKHGTICETTGHGDENSATQKSEVSFSMFTTNHPSRCDMTHTRKQNDQDDTYHPQQEQQR